jgi:hypothetical protein
VNYSFNLLLEPHIKDVSDLLAGFLIRCLMPLALKKYWNECGKSIRVKQRAIGR